MIEVIDAMIVRVEGMYFLRFSLYSSACYPAEKY